MLALNFVDENEDVDDDGAPIGHYLPGDPLFGACRAWERLGVGLRCETWLAWEMQRWCPAVVKFPRPHQFDHPRARHSLTREVAALAGNEHPALPRLYQDGTAEPVPFVAIEHVDGPAIDEEIACSGAFNPLEVALIATQVLAALRTLHSRGLAHIDVKPANVLLRDGRPVLADFGSARQIGAKQPAAQPIGSPGYAAPELEAGAPISAAMDVYGLGLTLYEALIGDAAFDTALAALDRPALAPLPPSGVVDLVVEMVAPDPAKRPGVDEAIRRAGAFAASAGAPAWPDWAQLGRA